jgi:hydrogenase 3 maturation protease
MKQLQDRIRDKRYVIVGVGNPLRGDDGAGSFLVNRLHGKTHVPLVDAGDVPENYLGVVKSAQPELVLIVDAVELGAHPGDAAIVETQQLGGTMATTHNTSLALFAKAVQYETGADIFVLGIQPGTTEFGAPMSLPVEKTLAYLEKLLSN